VEITGVDRERANFFLEASRFDLPVALSRFYEAGFEDEAPIEEAQEVIIDRNSSDDEVQVIDDLNETDLAARGSNRSDKMSGKGGGKPGEEKKKIATLFSADDSPGGRESSSDDDDERKGQAFYVGGSEKSGQQVLGPPKKKADNLAEKFFEKARERGAEQIDAGQRGAAAAAGSSKSTFSGAGYRLGDTVRPAEKTGGEKSADSDVQAISVTVVMRMWQNGFTIDDGPLRTFDSPADRQFLEHIMQGRLPPELIQTHRGKQIDLEMEDHRQEEYKPPKQTKAFTGQGHMLGSPVPDVVGAGKIGEKSNAAASAANGASANVPEPISQPPVDESKPITNIQVRLGNGDRLVLKLNHDHTVKDLRDFINLMRPDLATRTFVLMTNFPNKELTNESATLVEANLLNAVIIQRFK